MITLELVKQALMIDFNDQDSYLSILMNTAIDRASIITGIPTTINVVNELGEVTGTAPNPLFYTAEIEGAIIDDIAAMYQSRGDRVTGSEKSIWTYRRLSVKPMF